MVTWILRRLCNQTSSLPHSIKSTSGRRSCATGGHTPNSPANIRNMWSRIFTWSDEFGDIHRAADGNLVFDDDHGNSRNGAPPLKPEEFARFDERAAARQYLPGGEHRSLSSELRLLLQKCHATRGESWQVASKRWIEKEKSAYRVSSQLADSPRLCLTPASFG
jgi:hypothetical protein